MKKVSLIVFLTLMMVSFQGNAQKVSTVIVSGEQATTKSHIEVVNPDYTVSIISYGKDENILVMLKKELDVWLNKGYVIESTTTAGSQSKVIYKTIYVLVKPIE